MSNQNSTGEMTFDLGQQQSYKFTSEPLDPKPDYQFKLLGKQASVAKKDEPGKMPYVTCPIEVLNTTKKEGDKNRVLFHMFFTSLKPSKDGKLLTNRQDQVVGLAHATGSLPNLPVVSIPTGEVNEQTGEAITQKCLNPQAVKTWLEGLDGKIVKGKVKTDKSGESQGYGAKSVIDVFHPVLASQSSTGSPDPFAEEDKKNKKK